MTCDVFGRLPLRKMSDAIEHDLLVWADDEAPRPRDRSGGPRARRLEDSCLLTDFPENAPQPLMARMSIVP